jgi:plasmid stabilization system protein ParE
VRLTVGAQQDLIDIQEQGLATFGLAAARSHMQGFEAVFTLLRAYPGAGEARPDYGDGIRVFSHRPHRVVYHVADGNVLIVRILHSAMDAISALKSAT